MQEHEKCTNCGNKFVRSMLTFDLLPLIEFQLAQGISDEEALKYIREDPQSERKNSRSSGFTSRAEVGSEVSQAWHCNEYGKITFGDKIWRMNIDIRRGFLLLLLFLSSFL